MFETQKSVNKTSLAEIDWFQHQNTCKSQNVTGPVGQEFSQVFLTKNRYHLRPRTIDMEVAEST